MNYPRLIIAGVQSGVGKTTLSLGLMSALSNRGLVVQPFKVGPDYIDSGLHFQACGRRSHNLDSWMGTEEVLKTVFAKNAADADVAVIEGVMGLFDGVKGGHIQGSTAELAILLDAPLILVVNVQGMAQSCVAIIKGFMDYEPRLKITAVVLNNASAYHQTVLRKNIEAELGIKVLGCLPRQAEIKMPSRHLGLLPADENTEIQAIIARMADLIEAQLEVDAIIKMAQAAAAPNINKECLARLNQSRAEAKRTIIGVARDAAFSFYYQDNLDYLEELGAEIICFSPLKDATLPDMDGIYLGGGFPEMFLPQLEANHSMMNAIREAHQIAMPIYAECGGFIYLCERISDFAGRIWSGVGLVPAQASLSKCLEGLGYVEASAARDSILANQGEVLRGHEFHYSTISGFNDGQAAYHLNGGKGEDGRGDGYALDNLLGSYVHLHLRSNPTAANHFINACAAFKSSKEGHHPAATIGS